jgi:hypothetical protein
VREILSNGFGEEKKTGLASYLQALVQQPPVPSSQDCSELLGTAKSRPVVSGLKNLSAVLCARGAATSADSGPDLINKAPAVIQEDAGQFMPYERYLFRALALDELNRPVDSRKHLPALLGLKESLYVMTDKQSLWRSHHRLVKTTEMTSWSALQGFGYGIGRDVLYDSLIHPSKSLQGHLQSFGSGVTHGDHVGYGQQGVCSTR